MCSSTGRVKRLKWDASLAAKAQAHANGCKWGHSTGAALAGNGESIMSQPVAFPVRGLDVCSYAAWALYQEVSNYNFNAPGTSWETDMPVGHLINRAHHCSSGSQGHCVAAAACTATFPRRRPAHPAVLWAETTRLGCGFTACPSLGSYVVCWYGPGFYKTPDYHSAMGANVPRSRCQLATKDDWCERCSGSTCTRCFERPNYGQRMARFPIRYDKTRKRVRAAGAAS